MATTVKLKLWDPKEAHHKHVIIASLFVTLPTNHSFIGHLLSFLFFSRMMKRMETYNQAG
jgi:hypothetical protein